MIPSDSAFLEEDFKIEDQPTKTYKMNRTNCTIRGYSDELEAVKQAIYKVLLTERYQHVMYSWDYGIETLDLYGQPIEYVCPELERRITEALTWDDRIRSVDNFEFSIPQKDLIHVTFTVHTIFGDTEAEKEVNF